MAVFRIERTRDYTVMSNHHLRSAELSLKAKGLLSMMLSLPDDWNYTTRGLAKICKEGVDAIGGALRELERAGYIVRRQLRDKSGRISDTEYIIYEKPQPKQPDTPQPDTEKPDLEEPDMEKPAELNIDGSKIDQPKKDRAMTDSFPLPSSQGREREETVNIYRELILENIEYDVLLTDGGICKEQLDEIVDLILETVCTARKTIRIAGDDYPAELVKSKFLKLNSDHIRFVFDCLRQNTAKVRNIKQYLRAMLFNAPSTISNYYCAAVSHDLYGK